MVRMVEIQSSDLHVSREYRISQRRVSRTRTQAKNKLKQPQESRLIRSLFPIWNSASRSNPQGLIPAGRMTYSYSSYPCLTSSCPACVKVAEKKSCRVCRSLPVERSSRAKCM